MTSALQFQTSSLALTTNTEYAAWINPLYTYDKDGDIEISIRTQTGKNFSVKVHPNENILSIKTKLQNKEGIPPEQQRLIFAGRELDEYRTLNEYTTDTKGLVFFLVLRLRGGGGSSIGFNFSDLERRRIIDFGSAPKWRLVIQGMNLEGKCTNDSCEANKKRVWIQKGIGKFDIAREIFEAKCPSCNQKASEVNTVGFWDCRYVIDGAQSEPIEKKVNQEDMAPKEQFLTFLPNQVKWSFLTIETQKKTNVTEASGNNCILV